MRETSVYTFHVRTASRKVRLSPIEVRIELQVFRRRDITWHRILHRWRLHQLWFLKHAHQHEAKQSFLSTSNRIGLKVPPGSDRKYFVEYRRRIESLAKEQALNCYQPDARNPDSVERT